MKKDTTYIAGCYPQIFEIQSKAFFLAYETIHDSPQPKKPELLLTYDEEIHKKSNEKNL
jgi:hypothetical protein